MVSSTVKMTNKVIRSFIAEGGGTRRRNVLGKNEQSGDPCLARRCLSRARKIVRSHTERLHPLSSSLNGYWKECRKGEQCGLGLTV